MSIELSSIAEEIFGEIDDNDFLPLLNQHEQPDDQQKRLANKSDRLDDAELSKLDDVQEDFIGLSDCEREKANWRNECRRARARKREKREKDREEYRARRLAGEDLPNQVQRHLFTFKDCTLLIALSQGKSDFEISELIFGD
jgi:hypothetical protein